MPQTQINVYSQVVQISQHYLGPAASRFIDRQIRTHLNKEPDDLADTDIKDLVDWIRLAVAVLTEDTKVVNEYSQRLLHLSTGDTSEPYA